ncbi:MAG: cyanophycin synthetase [Candidatus Binatia bacterium]
MEFDVAVFTNLSHDHLNFHPDMHHYRRAPRGRLFEELAERRQARHRGGERRRPARRLHRRGEPRAALVTYGVPATRWCEPGRCRRPWPGCSSSPIRRAARSTSGCATSAPIRCSNALAALAVGEVLGVPLATLARGLADAPPVPGRFELVDAGQDFVVAVDYAHSFIALARLIDSARALRPRRSITVFGCGGERDRRASADGPAAAAGSDLTVITSNPRGEDPAAIVAEIVAGARAVDALARASSSRSTAPPPSRSRSRAPGRADIVLIAGKGHEPYQAACWADATTSTIAFGGAAVLDAGRRPGRRRVRRGCGARGITPGTRRRPPPAYRRGPRARARRGCRACARRR